MEESKEDLDQKIIDYYKDPVKGLSIPNVYEKLKDEGYKVTYKKIKEVLTSKASDNELNYFESKRYTKQKDFYLKTVGRIGDYQADLFEIR